MLIVNSLNCLDEPCLPRSDKLERKLRTRSCRIEDWGMRKARGGTWRDREEKVTISSCDFYITKLISGTSTSTDSPIRLTRLLSA